MDNKEKEQKLNINANSSGFLEMAEYFNKVEEVRSQNKKTKKDKDQRVR